jgi:hypothetical protein
LIDIARVNAMLPTLATGLARAGILSKLPRRAQLVLQDSLPPVHHRQKLVGYEIDRILSVIKRLKIQVILLKGAAFVVGGLPAARGRSMSDLDILVLREDIDRVESALLDSGWKQSRLSDHDEVYYRQWMHEIPPMWHPDRGMVVDIHHTIFPPMSRIRPDTEALIEAAVPLGGLGVWLLCPADMVLHSACHLINEEFTQPLRDLHDIHALLQHFGKDPDFWRDLLERACLHGLGRTLYYALGHARAQFGTFVPPEALSAISRHAPVGPLAILMDWVFRSAFVPLVPGHWQIKRQVSFWLLLLRSHWIKMPPRLLIYHLSIKAWRGLRPNRETESHA